MKRFFVVLFLSFVTLLTYSQSGTLRGKITDAETGEELIGAAVLIDDTYNGSSADLDGNYSISDITPGKTNITCSYISYETQKITDLEISDGEVTLLNIKLKSVSVGLAEIVVAAKAVRNTESALLTMQKKSASVIDGISAQQISRSGDSDAAGAVKRISGVSVVGGKYVYVRGLGDRYSKTTLNGAEIPSLDPEKNTVQMDIFPTNAIENMVVYKSFSPNLNSFTGGLIDIVTKDFPEKFNLSFSTSFEYNSQSSFNNNFLTYEGGKMDGIGFDDGTRDFPVLPEEIPLYPTDRDAIDNITKQFNKNMEPTTGSTFLNQKYSFTVGNQMQLFGKTLGFNFGLSYNNDQSFFNDGKRGLYKLTDKNAKTLNTEQQYNETKGTTEALIGSLLNLNYKLNNNNKIGYILMYNHVGEKNAFFHFGQKPSDEIGMFIENRELWFQERAIIANQFKGEHYFESFAKLKINWIISYTNSKQKEPDIRFFTNSFYPDAAEGARYEINPSKYQVPSRYNRNMDEYNLDNKVHFEIPFTSWGNKSKLKFGTFYVYKNRTFTEAKIDYQTQVQYYSGSVSEYLDDGNIGQNHPLYDPVSRSNYGLYIQNSTDLRNSYDAVQPVFGGYAMVDMLLSSLFRVEAGLRYEKNNTLTESKKRDIEKGELDDSDFLPAINLTYTLINNMNLRLSKQGPGIRMIWINRMD